MTGVEAMKDDIERLFKAILKEQIAIGIRWTKMQGYRQPAKWIVRAAGIADSALAKVDATLPSVRRIELAIENLTEARENYLRLWADPEGDASTMFRKMMARLRMVKAVARCSRQHRSEAGKASLASDLS
jgi:hypothetical protein